MDAKVYDRREVQSPCLGYAKIGKEGVATLELAPEHECWTLLFYVILAPSIVRGLALAWSSSPGAEPGEALFPEVSPSTGLVVIDTSEMKFEHRDRLDLLNQIEKAEGNELRLLLISDEQLASLVSAMSIGTAVRVVQAATPAVNKTARPTPVAAKIIRNEKGLRRLSLPSNDFSGETPTNQQERRMSVRDECKG